MTDTPIRPYVADGLTIRPPDPAAPEVAEQVIALIRAVRPDLQPEHIGSTAVPGLPGKGVLDLMIPAGPAAIPAITRDLLALGFGPQGGIAPWPPTRPMLVGSIEAGDRTYQIHCHVLPRAALEVEAQRRFRAALRDDEALRDAYARVKERIAAAGEQGTGEYGVEKAAFIEDAMLRVGALPRPADHGAPRIEPGATIGILGGGQLGRMLALSARAMGYRVAILDPDERCPARGVADQQIVGWYDDLKAARQLASMSDVVTYELEHVDAAVVEAVAGRVPVRPGIRALRATQDRLAERRFVRDQGELTADWREVVDRASVQAAAEELGYPVRLKVAFGGYDGRSQARIAGPDGLDEALRSVVGDVGRGRFDRPLLLERELDFDLELSVVCARDIDGRTLAFPVSRNRHDAGILVESVAPAPIHPLHAADAQAIGARLARALDVVGVMTVELFLLEGRYLAVNELAPRVHNSGHWTIEGATTSQFGQHIRAICGLPLGSVEAHGTAAMVNLLGRGPKRDARLLGVPAALEDPTVAVHVYDKRQVYERRKMGHLTAVARSGEVEAALERARAAAAKLTWA